jgi:hypothetical protein
MIILAHDRRRIVRFDVTEHLGKIIAQVGGVQHRYKRLAAWLFALTVDAAVAKCHIVHAFPGRNLPI